MRKVSHSEPRETHPRGGEDTGNGDDELTAEARKTACAGKPRGKWNPPKAAVLKTSCRAKLMGHWGERNKALG